MSKKTILVVCVVLAFIVGCQQQNLTWTPTPGEWSSMTPEQRNEWSANEMRARQRMWSAFQQRRPQRREIIVVPNQNQGVIDISSPSAYDYEIGRW